MELTIEFIKNKVIATEDLLNRSKIIKRILESFQVSPQRQKMIAGEAYYRGNHNILNDTKRDNKIVVNVNKVITDQKVGYINMSAVKTEVEPTPEERSETTLNVFGESLTKQLDQKERLKFHNLHTSSSSKGLEWLHYFLNEEGNFATKLIDGESTIEIRNKEAELEMIIRFYFRDQWNGETFDKRYIVEIWDKDMSWTFKETIEKVNREEVSIFVIDGDLPLNPCPHIVHAVDATLDAYYNYMKAKFTESPIPFINIADFETSDANVTVHGWGKVPFSPLYNNQEKEGDIYLYRTMQDDLNKNVSDISNNFDEIQDVITFTKGMEEMLRDSNGEDLDPIAAAKLGNYIIKKAKHVNLPAGKEEEGDFGFKTVDIPVEKRYSHIESLLSMMYMVAMAVSPKQLMESQVTTGVGITKLFSLLDIKANNNTAYINLLLEDYGAFYSKYYNVVENTEFSSKNIKWIMSKNRLMNTKEMVEIAILLSQIITRKSAIKTLPQEIVENVATELDELLKEQTGVTGEQL